MKTNEARSLLRNMFEAAITAAQPAHCIPLHLPEPRRRAAD
jgi:glycerate-2-kinase